MSDKVRLIAISIATMGALLLPIQASAVSGSYTFSGDECSAGSDTHYITSKWLNSTSNGSRPMYTLAFSRASDTVSFVYNYQVLENGSWIVKESETGSFPALDNTYIHGSSYPAASLFESRIMVTFTSSGLSCSTVMYAYA